MPYRIAKYIDGQWESDRVDLYDRDHAIRLAAEIADNDRPTRVSNERGATLWQSDRDLTDAQE